MKFFFRCFDLDFSSLGFPSFELWELFGGKKKAFLGFFPWIVVV